MNSMSPRMNPRGMAPMGYGPGPGPMRPPHNSMGPGGPGGPGGPMPPMGMPPGGPGPGRGGPWQPNAPNNVSLFTTTLSLSL